MVSWLVHPPHVQIGIVEEKRSYNDYKDREIEDWSLEEMVEDVVVLASKTCAGIEGGIDSIPDKVDDDGTPHDEMMEPNPTKTLQRYFEGHHDHHTSVSD